MYRIKNKETNTIYPSEHLKLEKAKCEIEKCIDNDIRNNLKYTYAIVDEGGNEIEVLGGE